MFYDYIYKMGGFVLFFFFSSRRRHTISLCDWSSDVCSSDLVAAGLDAHAGQDVLTAVVGQRERVGEHLGDRLKRERPVMVPLAVQLAIDRCQADREVVTLLAGLLGRVVASLGVVEAIQASRIGDTMALEQLPQAGPDPSAHLDVRHAWRTLHGWRWAIERLGRQGTRSDVLPRLRDTDISLLALLLSMQSSGAHGMRPIA